jgi:hypothetical protein
MKRGSLLKTILFVVLVIALFAVLRFAIQVIGTLLYYGVTLAAAIVLALVIVGYFRRGRS